MMRTLTPIQAFNDLRTMEQALERLFRADAPVATNATHTIPLDVLESDGKLIVRASVPGIQPDQLDISVENNVLTIRGEVAQEAQSEGTKVYRRETFYGSFSRSLRLPENLNLSEVDAQFKNGVVTISIPRVIEEKPEPIKIQVRSLEA